LWNITTKISNLTENYIKDFVIYILLREGKKTKYTKNWRFENGKQTMG
jgi:hypothetical protein